MREFICEICGKKAIDYTHSKCMKYCSKKCAEIAKKQIPCRYNPGVMCINGKCDKCGWNPKVTKERMNRILGTKDE